MRPVGYVSRTPKSEQKLGRAANSARRSNDELVVGVTEWIEKKFYRKDKRNLMQKLWDGEWSSELVINNVKSEDEVQLIATHGVKILRLKEIITELRTGEFVVNSASGADFIDLIHMGAESK